MTSLCGNPPRAARLLSLLLCILLALACAVYIGLTLLFVDAVSHQPPAP